MERPDCRRPSDGDKANIAGTRTQRRVRPSLRPFWLSYNDPAWIAQRHAGAAGMQAAVQTMTGALNAIAAEATSAAAKK